MKIVWRNPNTIIPKKVSIIKTGQLEVAGQVQLFYRTSAGAGMLGSEFELFVNPTRVA
ncbi:MAG TPA: hypothetical protein VMI10_21050 [Terriglobales bacterium]|nr:hypothetical protein [Terriglobales bacterium]